MVNAWRHWGVVVGAPTGFVVGVEVSNVGVYVGCSDGLFVGLEVRFIEGLGVG